MVILATFCWNKVYAYQHHHPQVPGLVNVDFADVRAIMKDAGSSLLGIGTATEVNHGNQLVIFLKGYKEAYPKHWKTRARDAALNAIQSPLLDIGIERATGIVWNITGGTDLTLFELEHDISQEFKTWGVSTKFVNAAAEVIYDLVDPTANLIFGAVIDPSLTGQVSITLIATGFNRRDKVEGRGTQRGHGDVSLGTNRRPSDPEGGSVEIPEFLRKKGRSLFPRI
ncbi:CELL DIVISION PROTEIN FTSZ-RELATED [Salix viminalis]|uniref:CELL DIVISION PROTEIN FTSZ-RELATED n=1 Tax=Salix viminalis TaxID=40686 RepID=A0A9Q0NL28_SALVM|nr:CELL DIVISION PROTEIN FTSZ-RELATED [Salix viminalis]